MLIILKTNAPLSLCMIRYTALQYKAIFSHYIAVAVREDFCATAVPQQFNLLSPLGVGAGDLFYLFV